MNKHLDILTELLIWKWNQLSNNVSHKWENQTEPNRITHIKFCIYNHLQDE